VVDQVPRVDQQFERTARLERELNVTINRITRNGERTPIYLDEIEAGDPTGADPKISCGLFCMSEADSFNTTNADAMASPPLTPQDNAQG
jgi:hypothetical protein